MDVDGVLTDGRIWLTWTSDGMAHEIKGFSAHDGVRLKLARAAGLRTGIITGRQSAAVTHRARELEMDFVEQDAFEKLPAYEKIRQTSGLRDQEICFVGDDVTDLPLFARVGLAVAVANGVEEVRLTAHYVTKRPGGRGAVREVVEHILKAKGLWDQVTSPYR